MQKTGRDQTPPLPMNNQRRVFGSQEDCHLPANTETVTEDDLCQIEGDIDDQNDDGCKVRARKKRRGELAGSHVDGPWPQLYAAIRADAITYGYEGPAVRAHAALFHGLIVAAL